MTLVSYDVKLDLQNDAIELFGIRYALTCFRELGLGEPGDTFRIVSREPDGVIVLQRVSREPTAAGALKDLRQRLGMETSASPPPPPEPPAKRVINEFAPGFRPTQNRRESR